MTTTKTRASRDVPYQLDDFLVKIHRSPAGIAWRWRTEIVVFILLLAAFLWLASQLSSVPWALITLGAGIGILFLIPQTRRVMIARFWCVLARHRFHRLCWEARLHTRSGRVPMVLWVRPTRVGERLYVWCRAGTAAEDFENHTGELRAACYAREARVTRNTRWSQIVTIDIIRRDTLAASQQVTSPLRRLLVIHDPDGRLSPVPLPSGSDTSDGNGPPPWPQQPASPN